MRFSLSTAPGRRANATTETPSTRTPPLSTATTPALDDERDGDRLGRIVLDLGDDDAVVAVAHRVDAPIASPPEMRSAVSTTGAAWGRDRRAGPSRPGTNQSLPLRTHHPSRTEP